MAPSTLKALADLESMWATVDALHATREVLTERPPNSFTLNEYCEKYNCARTTGRDWLKKQVRLGRMRSAVALLPDSRSHMSEQVVYWRA